MQAGKLSIVLEDHPTMGKVFIIKANNVEHNTFELLDQDEDGFGNLVLRITPQTMLLISQYADEMFTDDVNGLSRETH